MLSIPSTYTAIFKTSVDMSLFAKTVVTFSQATGNVLNIVFPAFEPGITEFTVDLTQEQTLLFKPGTVKIQISSITEDNERWNSDQFAETAKYALYKEVLTND